MLYSMVQNPIKEKRKRIHINSPVSVRVTRRLTVSLARLQLLAPPPPSESLVRQFDITSWLKHTVKGLLFTFANTTPKYCSLHLRIVHIHLTLQPASKSIFFKHKIAFLHCFFFWWFTPTFFIFSFSLVYIRIENYVEPISNLTTAVYTIHIHGYLLLYSCHVIFCLFICHSNLLLFSCSPFRSVSLLFRLLFFVFLALFLYS